MRVLDLIREWREKRDAMRVSEEWLLAFSDPSATLEPRLPAYNSYNLMTLTTELPPP